MTMDRKSKLKSPSEMRAEVEGTAESPPVLPATTTFAIDEVVQGVRYHGTFAFSVPTIADQIVIGQLKNKYLPGGGNADPSSALLVEYVCYLEVTLTAKPDWWKPMEFRNAYLLMKVYAEAVAYANRFLGRDKDNGRVAEADEAEDRDGEPSDDEGFVDEIVSGPKQRSKVVIAHTP